jgi:protein-tyrosine-phosphatase
LHRKFGSLNYGRGDSQSRRDGQVSRLFGREPTEGPNPSICNRFTKKLHYDVSSLRSKSWKEFSGPDAQKLDFVFTVCDNAAKEPCPVWPGQPMTAHWGIPDPAEATGNEAEVRFVFADTMRMLTNRINIFVSLPLKSLDQLTLQKQLDAIGKTKDATEKPASAA